MFLWGVSTSPCMVNVLVAIEMPQVQFIDKMVVCVPVVTQTQLGMCSSCCRGTCPLSTRSRKLLRFLRCSPATNVVSVPVVIPRQVPTIYNVHNVHSLRTSPGQ